MALMTRRWFVQQTAFVAGALYGCPMKALAEWQRIFGAREEHPAPLDASAIRKLASKITGHVITPDAPDYESARLIGNRAFDRYPALAPDGSLWYTGQGAIQEGARFCEKSSKTTSWCAACSSSSLLFWEEVYG